MNPRAQRSQAIVPVLLLAFGSAVQANTITVSPPQGISSAVLMSSPGDTILVSPGTYIAECGSTIIHPLTIIGVGGADANDVRVDGECNFRLFDVLQTAGTVSIQGLAITRFVREPLSQAVGIRVTGPPAVVIRNCVFHDLHNSAITMAATDVHLEGNVFYGQQSGVHMTSGDAEIIGNTFASSWNGLTMEGGASPFIQNNIFASAAVVCLTADNAPSFECNDAFNNGGSTYFGCSNPTGSDGNISLDPLFCDAVANNFRLQPGSPCLPQNSPPGCGLIGALGPCESASGVPDVEAARLGLTLSPNPFRHATTIGFKDGLHDAILEIYNPQGQVVEVVRAVRSPYSWAPSSSTPPGIYFLRLSSAGGSNVVKVVLLP
jgi:hypothetical protein